MARGLYSVVTPLPFSKAAAVEMSKVFRTLLNLRNQQGRAGEILDEVYAKVGDYKPIQNINDLYFNINRGSSWALQCYKSHGFHFHTHSNNCSELSFRRLLMFSKSGFTIEIFPINFDELKPIGLLEKYTINGPSLVELEFDGRMVHRFRPLDDGELFAYSIHIKDLSNDDKVASTQTHEYNDNAPNEIVEHQLSSTLLDDG